MKSSFKNNQYDLDGSYLFPNKETKIISVELDEKEYLLKYGETLLIPTRLLFLFVYIMKHKDKANRFNYFDHLKELSKDLSSSTIRNYIALLANHRFFNHKLLIRKTSHIYEVNPYFTYNNKPSSFVIEYNKTLK